MPENTKPHVIKAALWMTGAIVSFTSMAIAGREIADDHDTFEIMMFRSIIGLIIVVGFITFYNKWHDVTYNLFAKHVIRNLAHFSGQNLWFYAITLIPLAQVFTLEFTSPFWVVVLAPMMLNEALTRPKIFVAILGFIGVLIVTRPSPDTINVGLVSAAVSAVCFALTYIYTRQLIQHVTIYCILFWMTLLQLVFGIITVSIDTKISWPNSFTVPWLLVIGIGGLWAHFCISNALKIAPANVVIVFEFARLPVIFFVGWLIYNEDIEIWVAAGALLIFAAIYLNIKAETRQNQYL
ncbi:MAG: DMT family transporter [Aestuariivita sp.]|nr:DMT family transporter [Aestuariivita sp.]